MKTRYTGVTCDPNDFEKNGYFLHERQMNSRTELIICMTMVGSLAYSDRR
jgi:chitin synthase